MTNREQNQNENSIAKLHKYSREKENADRILSRYDLFVKFFMACAGISFFALFMFGVVTPIGLNVWGVIIFLVFGGGAIAGAIAVKRLKTAHQSKLDAKIMGKF